MSSDRELRNKTAYNLRETMAEALAQAYINGAAEGVRNTIICALDPEMSRQWKDDTAAKLPEEMREQFFADMQGVA